MLHIKNYTDMYVLAFWKTKVFFYVILCAKSWSLNPAAELVYHVRLLRLV